MSNASRRADAGADAPADRLQPWTAALLTALLHALVIWLALLSSPVTVRTPQGAAAGSPLQVTYIDETLRPPPPTPTPAARPAPPSTPAQAAPAATRLQSTRVTEADDPVPPDTPTTADSLTASRASEPPQPPDAPTPAPPAVPDDAAPRPAYMHGQPPGMLPRDAAPVSAGPARRPTASRGNDPGASGTTLEVGGYQVFYELISEDLLRAWRDQGITELFLPLPGTRRYMVCPLEVALRRGSGECRLVQPDAPELATIGDAREVLLMQRVYRMGEALWRGPGAYR